MIYFRNTGENFSDIHAAREAILRFARECSPQEHTETVLVFDEGEYTLSSPVIFSKEECPELENIAIKLACESGKAIFTSQKALDAEKFRKNGDYYTYQFEKDENGKYPSFRDIYLHGKRLPICKSVFFTHAFAFSDENRRNNAENFEGIYVPEEAAALLESSSLGSAEITMYVEWEFFTLHVIGVDKTRVKLD